MALRVGYAFSSKALPTAASGCYAPPSCADAVRRSISASSSLAIRRSTSPGCGLTHSIGLLRFERRRDNQARHAVTAKTTPSRSRMLSTKSKASMGGGGGGSVGPGGRTLGLGGGACGAFKVNRLRTTTVAKAAVSPAMDNQRADFNGDADCRGGGGAFSRTSLVGESIEL